MSRKHNAISILSSRVLPPFLNLSYRYTSRSLFLSLSLPLLLPLSIVLAVIYPRARRALIIVLTVRNAGRYYERSTVPRGTVTFKLTGSTPV